MGGYHSIARRGARIVMAARRLERQIARDRAWISDRSGNTYAGFPNNRAGRRAFHRSPFGRQKQPQRTPRVTGGARRGALAVAMMALCCLIVGSSPAQASRRLTRAEMADLASGRARITGGAAASFYVRKTGSDNNGGSSNGTAAQKTAADLVTNGTGTVTSATITFAAGDVDKLINIVGKGRYRITAFGSATSVTVSGSPSAGSGLTGNIGGAVLTVGALMANANAALVSGDTVYIGAGTYRETNTVQVSGVTWTGDVDGSKTGDSGKVEITAYTTDDKTVPASFATITLNGKINLTFQSLQIMGGWGVNAGCFDGNTTTSTGITFNDCSFIATTSSGSNALTAVTVFGTALNWTIDRCYFYISGGALGAISVTLPGSAAGPDYDANVVIRNSTMMNLTANATVALAGSASQFRGGGIKIYGCNLYVFANILQISTGSSWRFPCLFYGNVSTAALSAQASGQLLADYNVFFGNNSDSSVPTQAHSKTGSSAWAPLISLGQERIWGGRPRPFSEPLAGSPLLGFASGPDSRTGIPGTAANDSTVGTLDWTTVANAASQNDITFATASLAVNVVTHYAKLTNFGFAIPSDATVVGVIAIGFAKAGTTARIQDQNVQLVKGGVIGGTDKGTAATKLGTANNVPQLWGGTNDMWGLALTPADVNGSTFGIAVAYKNTNATTTVVSLDSVMLAVFYTSPSGALAVEIRNTGRPAGGGSALAAAGAYERLGTEQKETSVTQAGGTAGKLVGPGYSRDYEVPVDASSTTLKIYLRYDGTYDATIGRPQVELLANGLIGVAGQIVTATAGANGAYEQQTIGPFTPSAKGVVRLRVRSRDANGAGITYFDTFSDT